MRPKIIQPEAMKLWGYSSEWRLSHLFRVGFSTQKLIFVGRHKSGIFGDRPWVFTIIKQFCFTIFEPASISLICVKLIWFLLVFLICFTPINSVTCPGADWQEQNRCFHTLCFGIAYLWRGVVCTIFTVVSCQFFLPLAIFLLLHPFCILFASD